MELLSSRGIIINDMTVTGKPVLISNKAFKAYGTAGMDLAGANTYLGTEAVTETVGKSC